MPGLPPTHPLTTVVWLDGAFSLSNDVLGNQTHESFLKLKVPERVTWPNPSVPQVYKIQLLPRNEPFLLAWWNPGLLGRRVFTRK